VGGQGNKTPPRRLLCALSAAPSSQCTDDDSTEDSNAPPSKPLLDRHRARHDAPPEARFARTAVHSAALCAIPPHVARTVRHAYKLLPPWPVKGGGSRLAAGGATTKSTHSHTFRLHRDISTCLNQYLWDLEARPPLAPRLCPPPFASTKAQRNIVPRAHPCWMYGPRPESR
jgi:hypothetical protein